jgi:hypothetical protein
VTDRSRAVFLSYASEDVGAAKRIALSLQAAGIEVWFDQNELRGGDKWDQKIRRQVQDCALFIAVISANTELRREGYFPAGVEPCGRPLADDGGRHGLPDPRGHRCNRRVGRAGSRPVSSRAVDESTGGSRAFALR